MVDLLLTCLLKAITKTVVFIMVSQLLCLHDCTGPSYEWSCLKILHQLSGLLFQLGGIFGQQVCFPFSLIHFEWTWMVFFAYSAVPWKRNKHPVPDKHSVPTVNKCPWALNQIITVDRCHSLGCHGHLLHLVACTNLSVTFPPPSLCTVFIFDDFNQNSLWPHSKKYIYPTPGLHFSLFCW